MKYKGHIIKIDGIDGCGKSTLVRDLASHFKPVCRVVTTEEYRSHHDMVYRVSNTTYSVSHLLYQIALEPHLDFDDIERQVVMAVSARRNNRIVLARLRDKFDLILCDRSVFTNYASGFDLGREYECFMNVFLLSIAQMDCVFWIDVDPDIAFARSTRTFEDREGLTLDAIEAKGIAYQKKLAKCYGLVAAQDKRIVRIDGNRVYSDILNELINRIEGLLQHEG
jgi:thymidylate kinase